MRGKKASSKPRKPRDKNAPTRALSAYQCFFRVEHQAITKTGGRFTGDTCREIANQWHGLNDETKKKYVEEAAADRQRYAKELEAYKKTESYKNHQKVLKKYERKARQEQEKEDFAPPGINLSRFGKRAQADKSENGADNDNQNWTPPPDSIAIFSDSFLDHNREREAVLRRLRKQVIEAEEQNDLLSKHVETLTSVKDNLKRVASDRKERADALATELNSLRSRLSDTLSAVAIPTRIFEDSIPDQDNVDDYLKAIHTLSSSKEKDDVRIVERVKSALCKSFDT